jgi:hypothetical protein
MTERLDLRKAVLEKEPIRPGFDAYLIEDPVGFDLLVVGKHPAIPILVPRSFELPTASLGQNLHQAEQVLASDVHATIVMLRRCVTRVGYTVWTFWCQFWYQ